MSDTYPAIVISPFLHLNLTGMSDIPAVNFLTIDTWASTVPSSNSFATVATTGLYSDLLSKPTFATVATTGSYNDLLNKPATVVLPSFSDAEIPSGSASSYTLAHAPNPAASLQFFSNGLLLKSGGVDYTLSGSTVTTTLDQTGNSIIVWYRY